MIHLNYKMFKCCANVSSNLNVQQGTSRQIDWVGLVVSGSTSHRVGRVFVSQPGHTKDHHKNNTNCLPVWYAMR